MAKKPSNRTKSKSIEMQLIGSEPLDITTRDYVDVLNWYTYSCDSNQARDWLLGYAKKNLDSKTLQVLRAVDKRRIPNTIGWQARMMLNGNILSNKSMEFFNSNIENLINFKKSLLDEDDTPSPPKSISIQERTTNKNKIILSECESKVVDDRSSMYEFLSTNSVSSSAANFIRDEYIKNYNEIMSDDPDIKEAFGKKIKIERSFWQSVMDDLDRYIGNKKVVRVRKPRVKKQRTAAELIKNLKYLKEYPTYKVVSVNPSLLVGSQQLWTFNVKTRKLSHYVAVGPAGFSVKGTTLIGIDVEKSITKSVRKPEETLNALMKAGKVSLRKFMDSIKTNQTPATGRINTDTILVRVTK